jgi:hypothetical protein
MWQISYGHKNHIYAWNRILLEELTVTEMLKKFCKCSEITVVFYIPKVNKWRNKEYIF